MSETEKLVLFLGLDESLQSTLRRMLTRDHSSRPSAADLLAGCTIEEAISDIELNLMEVSSLLFLVFVLLLLLLFYKT